MEPNHCMHTKSGVSRGPLPVLALLSLGISGCREEQKVPLVLSAIRLNPATVVVTTDPTQRNRLLRRPGAALRWPASVLELPEDRVLGLVRARLNGHEIASVDRGIAYLHRGEPDYSPCTLQLKDGTKLFWASGSEKTAIFRTRRSGPGGWDPPQLVLGPSESQEALDAGGVTDPAVMRWKGTWLLFYAGKAVGQDEPYRIFCARSEDGVTWRRSPQTGPPLPILADPVGPQGMGRVQPTVCIKDGLLYLWYTDLRPGAAGLWLTTSRDGRVFEGIRRVAEGVTNADVAYCPALRAFVLVYGSTHDRFIRVAVSEDGINWRIPKPPAEVACGPPETIHHSPCFLKDERGWIKQETLVFYIGGVAYGENLAEPTWEIECSWIRLEP